MNKADEKTHVNISFLLLRGLPVDVAYSTMFLHTKRSFASDSALFPLSEMRFETASSHRKQGRALRRVPSLFVTSTSLEKTWNKSGRLWLLLCSESRVCYAVKWLMNIEKLFVYQAVSRSFPSVLPHLMIYRPGNTES